MHIADDAGIRIEGGNYTIIFWLNQSKADPDPPALYGVSSVNSGVLVQCDNSNDKITVYNINAGGFGTPVTSAGTFSEDAWVHVAVVYNSTHILIYLNGVSDKNGTIQIPAVYSGIRYLGYDVPNGRHFGGMFDDYRVFKVALTPHQVELIYNGGAGTELSLAELENPAPSNDSMTFTALNAYGGAAISNFTVTVKNDSDTFVFDTTGGAFSHDLANGSYEVNFTNIGNNTFFNVTGKTFIVAGGNSPATISTYQAYVIVTASEKVSGVAIGSSFTVYAPSQSNASSGGQALLLLNAGAYQLKGVSGSYYNTTLGISVSPFDNTSVDLSFFDYVVNVSAKNKITHHNLTTFSIKLASTDYAFSENKSTTTGNMSFNLSSSNFNATITAPGYTSASLNLTVPPGHNLSFELLPNNTIYVQIFSELTGALITDKNVTIKLTTSSYQYNFSTGNGTRVIQGVAPAVYNVDIGSEDGLYPYRRYKITLPESDSVELKAYLLNNSDGSYITLYVRDQYDKLTEGVTITATKQFNDTYQTVEQRDTDFSGAARFTLNAQTEYALLVSAPGYSTRMVTVTPTSTTYTIYMRSTTTIEFTSIFSLVSYAVVPSGNIINNNVTNFSLTVSSPSGVLEWFGVSVIYNDTTYSSNVSGVPNGGTAQFTINLTNATSQTITALYFIKVQGYNLYEFNKTFYPTSVVPGTESLVSIRDEELFPNLSTPMRWLATSIAAIVTALAISEFAGGVLSGFAGVMVILAAGLFGFVNMGLSLTITTLAVMLWLFFGRGEGT